MTEHTRSESQKSSKRSRQKVRHLSAGELTLPTEEAQATETEALAALEDELRAVKASSTTMAAVATADERYWTGVELNQGDARSVHAVELAIWKAISESQASITDIALLGSSSKPRLCADCYAVINEYAPDAHVWIRALTDSTWSEVTTLRELHDDEADQQENTSSETESTEDGDTAEKPHETEQEPGQTAGEETTELDIEYVHLEGDTYHRKYPQLNSTHCGISLEDREITVGDEKPQLLRPCKPCHGETRIQTVEEKKQELRRTLSERVADVQYSETNPATLSESELQGLMTALPVDVSGEISTPTEARHQLARAVRDVTHDPEEPTVFSREELEALTEAKEGKQLVPGEPHVLQASEAGDARVTPLSEFRVRRRAGQGKQTNIDEVVWAEIINPRDTLLAFTRSGQIHELPGHELLSEAEESDRISFSDVLRLAPDDNICGVLPARTLDTDEYIVTVSHKGYIKRTAVSEFSNILSTGIIAAEIGENDWLCDVAASSGEQDIMIATESGRTIRFHESEARPMGRSARGVMGIELDEDEAVVGAEIVDHANEAEGTLLTVTANGYGKRTAIDEYRTQSRYGLGLVDIVTDDRNGPATDITHLSSSTESVLLQTEQGYVIRIRRQEISTVSRNTKGVTLIDRPEDRVVSVIGN